MSHLAVSGILESALYVADLTLTADFYKRLFGFSILLKEDRMVALNVADKQVLLLFKTGGSLNGAEYPGGRIPAHDGTGPVHMAFQIPLDDFEVWRERLETEGIGVESVVHANKGKSIYFRDPDQHLVELATPGLWNNLPGAS